MDKEEEEKTDPELDNAIGQLGIAKYQENKLHRFLASRLDKSNPVALSKGLRHTLLNLGAESTESLLMWTHLSPKINQ